MEPIKDNSKVDEKVMEQVAASHEAQSAKQAAKPKNKYTTTGVLYVALVIIGQRLAGIGGVIGGAFIAYGISRVIKNPLYTTGKKVLYSALYSLGGVAIALAIALPLVYALNYYSPGIFLESNIESGYKTPAGFSSYNNRGIGVNAIAYPAGWTVFEAPKEEYFVRFSSPNGITNLNLSLNVLVGDKAIDYKTFTADVSKEISADGRVKMEIVSEEVKTIQGKEWLIIDSIITAVSTGNVFYNKIGIMTTNEDKRQYYQVLIESDKEHIVEDALVFDKAVESLRFYK